MRRPAPRQLVPLLLLALLVLLGACRSSGGHPPDSGPAPVADAGSDTTATTGQRVQLDGSASTGTDLVFTWEFTDRPDGSSASLENGSTATPSFTPDLAGDYRLRLTVAQGNRQDSDTVTVTVQQASTPVADAGPDSAVMAGSQVTLDGSASTDPGGGTLRFSWEFTDTPDGSSATLSNADGSWPRFTADLPGRYEVRLTVDNGQAQHSDTVTVTAMSTPVADAGTGFTEKTGRQVTLDGSGSHDPDGNSLSYAWAFISRPAGSSASLAGADTATPQLQIDQAGAYVLELTVSNAVASDSARVTVTGTDDPGQLSSTVYVAEAGSDSNPGTEAEPFRTPARALQAAAAGDGISRIRFGAGNYTVPASGLLIPKSLQLVGPDSGSGPAVLETSGDLFRVEPTASGGMTATFVRLTLQATQGIAAHADHGASISFTDVDCTADTCLSSRQELLSGNRGRLNVRDSTLRGGRNGSGITATGVTELQVMNSSISGFRNGITAGGSGSLSIRETTISDTGTGISLSLVVTAMISDTTVTDSLTGLSSSGSRDVQVLSSSIITTGSQVEVNRGGSLLLEGVTLESEEASPSLVIGASRSAGELVRISGSTIRGGAAGGIRVAGQSSILNLGTEAEPGNNGVTGGPAPLFDDRPDGATGIVTVNGTELNGSLPSPGQYRGPLFSDGIMISGDNLVVVY